MKETDSVDYYLELVRFSKTQNNYKDCLNLSQKAIDFAILTKNPKKIAHSYSMLGEIYIELKKYDYAIDVFKKSIVIYNTLEYSPEQAYTYYNIGICYMEKYNFKIAELYFNKAFAIFNTLKIQSAIDMLNLQKAIIYKQKGKKKLANDIFLELISKNDTANLNNILSEAYYQIGISENENYRYNLSINYLNRALKANLKNLDQKAKIALALSDSYEKNGNINKSLFYLKKHMQLNDSILYDIHTKIGINDVNSFKNSETLKQIEQLDKEKKSQEKAQIFSKLVNILAISLVIILTILSIILYKNNVIRSRSNELLREKNFELQIAKDKAEKASQARAEFLSTVSHELRTPLNAINGITHLLLEENPKKNQLNYLNSLKFSGHYLLTFINEILEINRIDSNKIEIEYIDFNLKKLLLDIQNSMHEIATINNNKFSIEIDDKIPEILQGDPTKLSQIFINLINNALKFTKNGEVKVIAKLLETGDDFSKINFAVEDTGIGIPKEKQETIFESFSQGSIEINRKYGGTGLGLTIVKKLIDLLGGEITLKSEVNVGTTFYFELNLRHGNEVIKVEKPKYYSDEMLLGKKILVVEDNKINQMVTKKMLEKKGMICKIIDTGEDSIEILSKENDFDLVLMDVHLPGINGTVATEQIRKFDTLKPIIALTAISLNENRETLLSFGITDVITKPFEPENFYNIMAINMV
ncbi:ATP-binding protein [Flavobacterium sp. RSB2_4_14]|uniref:tetratricopeptide repeat-containing hybrid sensor histidine kinase/response regulator n=1 Tax=Flavobacterium sp. RSB2_4_14 TaxID=3447665 RepID=UPI003F2FD52F